METLDQLNDYSSDELELWLDGRFREQYSPDPDVRYRAFDFRGLGVLTGESHIDQLIGLFKKLSRMSQVRFREAAGQLLRHAQPNDFPFEAMTDLIHIIGLTRSFKAFGSFIPIIGNGPWGELYQSLFYDALSVLLMFDRTLEAYEAAKGLATSINFPEAYVFDAYVILIRSQPEKWSEDLALLRKRFFMVRERVWSSGDQKQLELLGRRELDVALSLARAVPLSDLGLQFSNLDLISQRGNDRWLVDRLFGQTNLVRLEYNLDGNSLRLVTTSGTLHAATLSDASAFEAFCIKHGHLSVIPAVESLTTHYLSPEIQSALDNTTAIRRTAVSNELTEWIN